MKHRVFRDWILPALLIVSGCGDKPGAVTTVGEVRGQPIVRSSNAPMPAAPAPIALAVAPAASKVAASAAAPNTSATPPSAYPLVGFDKLAGYPIDISEDLLGPVTNDLAAAMAKTDALIPETVKGFSGKPVTLRGFMLPLKVEGGLVTELLIMKDQSMCCYGAVPKIHEWVSVKMTGKGVKPLMDQPVTLFGKLHVGEMRENGYLTGIYQMDGEGLGTTAP